MKVKSKKKKGKKDPLRDIQEDAISRGRKVLNGDQVRSKVEGFVLQTWDVNSRIVLQQNVLNGDHVRSKVDEFELTNFL
jgi:hypothetical protein